MSANIFKKLLFIVWFLTIALVDLSAYSANCNTNDGRSFSITVSNRVMTINNKYKAYYQKKTFLGWYKYSNKGYTYLIGKFNGNQFPIEVTNKWGLDVEGTCYFNN